MTNYLPLRLEIGALIAIFLCTIIVGSQYINSKQTAVIITRLFTQFKASLRAEHRLMTKISSLPIAITLVRTVMTKRVMN